MKNIDSSTEIDKIRSLKNDIVAYLKLEALRGYELLKVINLINEVKEIEEQYNSLVEKYKNVINHGFFKNDEPFITISNLFNFDSNHIFTLLNTTLTKNGFSSKNKISTRVLSDTELTYDIIEKYFDGIEYKIKKYFNFRNNMTEYIGNFIMFPEENLDHNKGNLIFSCSDWNYLYFYDIKYIDEENSFTGVRVIYDKSKHELMKSMYRIDLSDSKPSDVVKDKLYIAHPELFI